MHSAFKPTNFLATLTLILIRNPGVRMAGVLGNGSKAEIVLFPCISLLSRVSTAQTTTS
jgi:hypothetical protein